jgi:hypothetical protein
MATDERVINLEKIKKLVIVAMFSDSELESLLVLKGGNAIDIVHKLGTRASVDVDFSIADDLPEDLPKFRERVERALSSTFIPEGYEVFDVNLLPRPEKVSPELEAFWGGYVIEFKLLEAPLFAKLRDDLEAMRRSALKLGQKARFFIDISRHEYVEGKAQDFLDGYRVFVYSPEMIVCEKLRAICQQMPEYGAIVKRDRPGTARARDFLDIHTLIDARGIDVGSEENRTLLRNVFAAKRVPLELLGRVHGHREFHRGNYPAVRETVRPGIQVEDFDFYFDFVLEQVGRLKALWSK